VQLESLSVVFLALPVKTAQVAFTLFVAADADPPDDQMAPDIETVKATADSSRTARTLPMPTPSLVDQQRLLVRSTARNLNLPDTTAFVRYDPARRYARADKR
jgi:hypothetical protein